MNLSDRLALARAEQEAALEARINATGHYTGCMAYATLDEGDCDCAASTGPLTDLDRAIEAARLDPAVSTVRTPEWRKPGRHRAEPGYLDGWVAIGVALGLFGSWVLYIATGVPA